MVTVLEWGYRWLDRIWPWIPGLATRPQRHDAELMEGEIDEELSNIRTVVMEKLRPYFQPGGPLCKIQGKGYLHLLFVRVNSWPYICVKGLKDESEIRRLHHLLCQNAFREEYARKLGICYQLDSINPIGYSEEILLLHSPGNTTCGELAAIREERGPPVLVVTIGGLIELEKKFFLLTANHSLSSSTKGVAPPTSAVLSEGQLNEIHEIHEVPLLVEIQSSGLPFTFLDTLWAYATYIHKKLENTHLQIATILLGSVSFVLPRTLGPVLYSGPEWSMIRITDSFMLLPNIEGDLLPIPLMFIPSWLRLPSRFRSHWSKPRYLCVVADKPQKCHVYVLAGRSGKCPGCLSASESLVILPSGVSVVVWTIQLPFGFKLHQGDSGSWVVGRDTGVVYGHVFATTTNGNYAYLIPLKHTLGAIGKKYFDGKSPILPSPFTLLAELSKTYNLNPSLPEFGMKAAYYADEALTPQVLHQSPSSSTIQNILYFLHKCPEHRQALAEVIMVGGADITTAINTPEVLDRIVQNRNLTLPEKLALKWVLLQYFSVARDSE